MIVTEATIDIGFDGKKADDGIKQTRKNVKDLHDDAKKAGKELNNSLKDLRDLGREIATNPVFLGGAAIVAVSSELNKTARAIRETSYLAQNIALPENKIRAFGRIAEQSGASVDSMNGFLQTMAQKSAMINSGEFKVADVLGSAFSRYAKEGDAMKIATGSPEDALLVYAEMYKTIEKQAVIIKKTKEEQAAFASQELMRLGISADLIPILRMQGEELRKNIAEQSKLVGLTESDIELSKKYAQSWTEISQNIDTAVTKTKLFLINDFAGIMEVLANPTKELTIDKTIERWEKRLGTSLTLKPLKNEFDFFRKATSDQTVINYWKNQFNPAIKDTEASLNRAKTAAFDFGNTRLDNLLNQAEKLKNSLSGLNLNPLKGVGESLGGAVYDATHSQSVEPVYKMTTAKQKQNMAMVYQAYRKQGLSHNQAATMTSEVGRENDFNDKFLFGTHEDLAGGQNIGMISMQGDRNTKLRAYMTKLGLMKNGVMERSQRAIDAQAAFQVAEMKSGAYPKAEKFLAKPNIGRDESSELMGTGYVKWAKHQTRLRSGAAFNPDVHLAKEYGYYDQAKKFESLPIETPQQKQKNIEVQTIAKPQNFAPTQMAAQQAQAQHIATTNNTTNNNLSQQPFSVTNSFNIHATDPKGTANEVSEIFNKQKMMWSQTGQH